MPRKIHIGPNGGRYINYYGKKKYLSNLSNLSQFGAKINERYHSSEDIPEHLEFIELPDRSVSPHQGDNVIMEQPLRALLGPARPVLRFEAVADCIAPPDPNEDDLEPHRERHRRGNERRRQQGLREFSAAQIQRLALSSYYITYYQNAYGNDARRTDVFINVWLRPPPTVLTNAERYTTACQFANMALPRGENQYDPMNVG